MTRCTILAPPYYAPLTIRTTAPYSPGRRLVRENQIMIRHRWVIALAAIVTSLVLVAADADARVGGGMSSGSRGMRTFSVPPATSTAPNAAAPIQRSMTQPGATSTVGQAARPGLLGGGLF